MKNYALLKTIKLFCFTLTCFLFATSFNKAAVAHVIYIASISVLIVPLLFLEWILHPKIIEMVELLVFAFVAAILIFLTDMYGFDFSIETTFLFCTILIFYALQSHFYREYKAFSEDKYIFLVVSMYSFSLAAVFYIEGEFVWASGMLLYSGYEFLQWLYYYHARKFAKDEGQCSFELMVPSLVLCIAAIHNIVGYEIALFFYGVLPLSYYLYKKLINHVIRMHLYAVFIQFMLYVIIVYIVDPEFLMYGSKLLEGL